MNVGEAITYLKVGQMVRRNSWPAITYLYLDGEIIMYSNLGIESAWTPSHLDLLGDDWEQTMPTR